MDFSVGIAVLVLVTVLVVAVIGYGIYLNRRHNQWENVVGQSTSDGRSKDFGISDFAVSGQDSQKHSNSTVSSSHSASKRVTNKKTKRPRKLTRVAPTISKSRGKGTKSLVSPDAPELPHMSIEDAYRSGIPMTEGIIKHEIKGKRADVFGIDGESQRPLEKPTDVDSVVNGTMGSEEVNAESVLKKSEMTKHSNQPFLEGIVGEVVKKPRDETKSTIKARSGWTRENNAHVLRTDQPKTTKSSSKSSVSERVVPLRKGSTKILSSGASKARPENSRTGVENSRLEEYVILRVSGKHANAFPLRELARFMLNRNLKFDDDGLFSMHDEETNELMFKVADVYSPGQFNRAQIETYCTEGLTFIMCLAPLSNPQQSFESMLSLAGECARCFDATVQDEHSNKLSNQTITHYRYRVADFRRKKMSM